MSEKARSIIDYIVACVNDFADAHQMTPELKQLIEFATQDLVAEIVEHESLSIQEAMSKLYCSDFFVQLQGPATALYRESGTYLYAAFNSAISGAQNGPFAPWSFHELIHNCIAHQDYSMGASIVVSEFGDRLQFSNAGDFAPGTLEAALNYSGAYRRYANKQLAEAMVELKMIDTVGSGIRKIFNIQAKNRMPLPVYEFPSREIRVTLKGVPENLTGLEPAQLKLLGIRGDNRGDNRGNNQDAPLPPEQERICQIIAENPSISTRALAKQLNIRYNTAYKQVNSLKAKGILIRKGGTRGIWVVNR